MSEALSKKHEKVILERIKKYYREYLEGKGLKGRALDEAIENFVKKWKKSVGKDEEHTQM